MTPEGELNRQRRTRARQRARHALAMRHHDEYDWLVYLIEAEVGNSVTRETIKARAMQQIVNGHRAEFRALQEAEEAKEGVQRLPRGTPVKVPCGTKTARHRHMRRGESCEVCQQWYDEQRKQTCAICGTEYLRQAGGRRSYCGSDCRRLAWYLTYWFKSRERKRNRKRMPAPVARELAARRGLDLDALIARAENNELLIGWEAA